jgi:hypothetical protein
VLHRSRRGERGDAVPAHTVAVLAVELRNGHFR